MREGYLLALISAAFASVKYRSFRSIYEQSLFMGPWTELPDGTLTRTGNERWSNSTEEARTALAKILRGESYCRFVYVNPRVPTDCHPVVTGEAPADVGSRVAYAHARDSLIVALQQLAEISLDGGRDPRTSALYETLDLRHELLALLDLSPHDATPTHGFGPHGQLTDPVGIIRALYLAGKRKSHA